MLVVLSTQPCHIWPQDHSGQSMAAQGQGDLTQQEPDPDKEPDPDHANTDATVDSTSPSSTTPHPFHITPGLIDQAMDLWNDSGNQLGLEYLDEQFKRYIADWKALAAAHNTAPFRLVPSYVQTALHIPRQWIWSLTKNRTLEQQYNTLLALHLWLPSMTFPPITLPDETQVPPPTFWHPTAAEQDQAQTAEQEDQSQSQNALMNRNKPSELQQANQKALNQLPTCTSIKNPPQQQQLSRKTQKEFMTQMENFFPDEQAPSPNTDTTHTLAQGAASQTPGSYIELKNGILWDPALDTYKNAKGMQLHVEIGRAHV